MVKTRGTKRKADALQLADDFLNSLPDKINEGISVAKSMVEAGVFTKTHKKEWRIVLNDVEVLLAPNLSTF